MLDVSFGSFSFVMEYCQKNGIMDKAQEINDTINRLRAIQNNSIGVITLAEDLDIDSVTEILFESILRVWFCRKQILQCLRFLRMKYIMEM